MKITHLGCAAIVLSAAIAAAQQPARVNVLGAVESIDPASGRITLHSDDGKTVMIAPHVGAHVYRLPAGEKSLSKAVPIEAKEIVPGDRLLARGELSEDKAAMAATTLVVMTKADVAKQQQADRAEWQRRGVGGIVSSVEADKGEVTITTRTAEGKKPLIVEVTAKTAVRRYAPDSVKFADARPGTIAEIKVGDQVRALGAKSEDGTRYAAEEIVSGTFRNIAATVSSVDAAGNTLKIMDLATRKPVIVHVNSDSTLRKLPEMVARMIAMRTGGAQGGAPGAAPPNAQGGGAWQRPQGAAPGGPAGPPGGMRPHNGDLQQMLERMPPLKLEDLKPGDAIIVSSTQGADPSQVTAIMLVAGVEPILTAASSGSQRAAMLGSWNLDMGGGMGGEQ
ncbi:MAG TPA: hypothetical protein VMT86_09780 [Bryobacteraceae bacterium]|nr:hypothetical protein [Bryobacteraceae bacterium]